MNIKTNLHYMNNNDQSGVNTVLIVIVLLVIVAGGVWFYRGSMTKSQPQDTKIDVNLPAMQDNSAGNNQPQ
jgi:Flp pilus assembly protein TadG